MELPSRRDDIRIIFTCNNRLGTIIDHFRCIMGGSYSTENKNSCLFRDPREKLVELVTVQSIVFVVLRLA